MQGREYNRLMTMAEDIQKVVKEHMDKPEPPPEMFQFIIDMIGLFDRFDSAIDISGLSFGSEQLPIAKIASIGLKTSLETKDPAGSNFDISMGLSGFDTQMAPLPPGILPRDTRIEMALKNIPPNLAQRVMDIAFEGGPPTAKSEAYFQQQFIGLLMSSHLAFEVIDSFIAANDARVDLDLNAIVDPGSAMGGTGELSLRIENMQTVIDITGASNDQSVAPVLAMLTAFSNRTQENDKTVDSFNLKFTKDAKLFLNDKDVTAMFLPQ